MNSPAVRDVQYSTRCIFRLNDRSRVNGTASLVSYAPGEALLEFVSDDQTEKHTLGLLGRTEITHNRTMSGHHLVISIHDLLADYDDTYGFLTQDAQLADYVLRATRVAGS